MNEIINGQYTKNQLWEVQNRIDSFRGILSYYGGYSSIVLPDGRVYLYSFKRSGEVCTSYVNNVSNAVAVSPMGGVITTADSPYIFQGRMKDNESLCANITRDGRVELSDWGNPVFAEQVSHWTNMKALAGHTITTGVKRFPILIGLSRDGKVHALCSNSDCNTGEKSMIDRLLAPILQWKDIVAIAADWCGFYGVRSDGKVEVSGFDYQCVSVVRRWTDIVDISVTSNQVVGLKADGTVVSVSQDGTPSYDVSKWKKIVAIHANNLWTTGLREDGCVLITPTCGMSGTYGSWKEVSFAGKLGSVYAIPNLKVLGNTDESNSWRMDNPMISTNMTQGSFIEERIQERILLDQKKAELEEQLSHVKGLFAGKRRKALMLQIEEVEKRLKILGY